MNESTAVIDSIQLIPLDENDISSTMTKVKIKVFHLGLNRNRSYIDKDTALEMAKTLRGCPIVGKYREEKGDFTDHGEQITINDQGIKVECITQPYGFVDLNAKVWFEDYIDVDEFGNKLQHTYVVTEGTVWTGQYPELKETLLMGGRPQSMELNEETLQGNWAEEDNSNISFFIINNADITKLCILGEDVEPCFLGSNIIPEDNQNFNFSLNKDFGNKLYTMMQELKDALKGEQTKMDNENIVVEETPVSENFSISQDESVEEETEKTENNVETETSETVETPDSEFTAEAEVTENAEVVETEVEAEPIVEEVVEVVEAPAETEFAKAEEEKKEDEEESKPAEEEEATSAEKEDADDKKKEYALLEQKYNDLEAKYAALDAKYQELAAFKADKDNEAKDNLISTFDMLDEEDKKDVIANKAQYSLDEIESKLSVIYARKQRSLTKVVAETKATEEVPVIYTVQQDLSINPAWVNEVLSTQKTM